jgi:putative DNA primase/helicase
MKKTMKKPIAHNRDDLEDLPRVLRPLTIEKRWVNWVWELRTTDSGEQKWTKPPRLSSNPKQYAKSNDPSTWGSYAQAVQRWQDGDAEGIGFMLLGSGIAAIDLDHCCRRDAEAKKTRIDKWARELRDLAQGAYCEVTVSGRGLRLIGTSQGASVQRKFTIDKATDAATELFRDTARFITVSGLQLGNCHELTPIDDLIDVALVHYDKRGSARREQPSKTTAVRDYDDLIRNGAPVGERSEEFQAVVWHLASRGRSVDQIAHELAQYPNGIAAKYSKNLAKEVERSYGKWEREQSTARQHLPIIRVVEGEIARVVDEAEHALIKAGLPIFVRGGCLVEPITVEPEASDGRKTTTTVFGLVSEEKLTYRLNKDAATFEKFDGRRGSWVVSNPPVQTVKTLLMLKSWHLPEVICVVGAPTLRADGSLLSNRGYDPASRLWCESEMELPLIEQPTRSDAASALRLYKDLLSGFEFASATDRAVALAAILSVVLRGAFELTPMFVIKAHDVGNGKSYLVDLIATIVTGRPCPVITAGKTAEEMEKRLGAILLEGGTIISLDNISFDLESDLLCQILTQPIVKTRVLGKSVVPECEWRGTILATGNNVRVVGDLVRRTLSCNLDAKVERPELREFPFDPIARVHADRGAYIAAAITIARAYRAAGRAATNVRPLAGYAAWSAMVREPLLWLGEHDPVASMDTARAADPGRAAAYKLVTRWQSRIGVGKAISVRGMIEIANERKEHSMQLRFPKFRGLLLEHSGTHKGDEIDPKRLGKWLHKQHGRVYGGYRIDLVVHKGKPNDYVLSEVEGDNAGDIE